MSASEARRWLVFAKEDLETAQLEFDEKRPPRFACVNAQQAAEKAIKATAIAAGSSLRRTHDLDELIQLVPSTWQVAQTGVNLSKLTQLGSQRYPDAAATVTDGDAAAAISDARRIVEAAEADIDREAPAEDV